MATPTAIVAYLALFTLIGLLFLFANLMVGRFLRPSNPNEEKLEIYECGEPTIGSSFVQFDLRFYVVALVFIVFDVEVAFLFPLATVFGKSTNLLDERVQVAQVQSLNFELGIGEGGASEAAARDSAPAGSGAEALAGRVDGAKSLAALAFWGINVFFFVLLIGFAYEWRTGAFDWVHAVSGKTRASPVSRAPPEEFANPVTAAV